MMKGALGNLMQKAQEMQSNLQDAHAEIAKMEIRGESGGGMVKILINGAHEIKKIQLDDSLFADDKDMMEDLIAAAMNDAVHKLEKIKQEKLSGMTEGLEMPGGFKMPF